MEKALFLNDKTKSRNRKRNAEKKYSMRGTVQLYTVLYEEDPTRRQDKPRRKWKEGRRIYRRRRSLFELIVERPNRCKIDLTLHFLRMRAQGFAEECFYWESEDCIDLSDIVVGSFWIFIFPKILGMNPRFTVRPHSPTDWSMARLAPARLWSHAKAAGKPAYQKPRLTSPPMTLPWHQISQRQRILCRRRRLWTRELKRKEHMVPSVNAPSNWVFPGKMNPTV